MAMLHQLDWSMTSDTWIFAGIPLSSGHRGLDKSFDPILLGLFNPRILTRRRKLFFI